MADIRVIVVDDQRLVREGIASLLDLQEGISVVASAEDGRQGVHKIKEHKPDIVLMDIRMPVQDGIVSVEILKKEGFAGKVIMLTTFDDDEYIIKSLRAGAAGYLMKDIPVEDLAQAVKQAHRGVYQMTPAAMGTLIGRSEASTSSPENLISDQQKSMIAALSEREREVFLGIGEGLTNGEIAEKLFLSEGTVKNYVSGIFMALGLRDRVQAALLASRWSGEMD
jgi:DNA-binding NarL/FixJ family response regulator